MRNFGLTETLDIGGRAVTIQELSVAEVRAWLMQSAEGMASADPVGALLLPDITLTDIARMTDLIPADMERMAPSDLDAVAGHCKRVNSFFFSLRSLVEVVPSIPSSAS